MEYKVGQVVEGKVTGLQPYGAFVSIDKNISGLIHISEISDGFVKDIHSYVEVGQLIKAKIIDLDEKNSQVKLSLKALQKRRFHQRHVSLRDDRPSLPLMRRGFRSIEIQLDKWIEEAKKEMK
ncbi:MULTISPECIES: CvfD/Ygs/GSP13 family RNA-binding post-transcriptional regulator [Terrabacteria group]|uniref:CvfD/Ygs/GSP13 family RNA-binding post-transcriptional regulator n=1 Tax=Bacillati TaxID=1783272 RepID=UPI00193939FF|nr:MULTISPECIES: CvfD/Ygs/GSP13 family RNA-binding post-transcriptional regulator [Terrabacteria group]MBW9212138.1 S1 RNA-binding domain-containing protein [Trueperella sp. zg.1013]QRG86316.1 S1 RNA-binding domain-containing protein [Bulleidia sp. zg-1006]